MFKIVIKIIGPEVIMFITDYLVTNVLKRNLLQFCFINNL